MQGKTQQQTTVPTQSNPINFEMAFVRLQRLSRDLSQLGANGTMTYSGQPGWATVQLKCAAGASLQVFALASSALTGTTSIQFTNCPSGSTIVVNVSGASAQIGNAGINGIPSFNRAIWNFYQATSLATSSVFFYGSILAPYADTAFTWGAMNGTLAAWSTESSAEFHFIPFHDNVIMPGI
jgi:choice-of-anchor A domain-containing protein